MDVRRVIGCMTGTSLDGLDAALVEIRGRGLEMVPKFVRGTSAPLGDVGKGLRELAEQRPASAGSIAGLMHDFALLHARVIRECLDGERCDLACVHGQTVYHKPPVSWQLMQPAPIVSDLGAPVVYDLRQADLAAGGQGAPITPIADYIFFRGLRRRVAVVNLGGFCNITLLDGRYGIERIEARDVCACNHVLDRVAREVLGMPFDADGFAAAHGTVIQGAREELMSLLSDQHAAGRSLGTGDELATWVERHKACCRPQDLCATACNAVADVIAREAEAEMVILAGGGTRNRALTASIGSRSDRAVIDSDAVGLPSLYREAACFAVLGALCQDRVPVSLPAVTGCRMPAPLSGAWAFPSER